MFSSTSDLFAAFITQYWPLNINWILRHFCYVGYGQPWVHARLRRSSVIKGVYMCLDASGSTHRTYFSITKCNATVQVTCLTLFPKVTQCINFAMRGWVTIDILSVMRSYENVALEVCNDSRNRHISLRNCYFGFLLAKFANLKYTIMANIWLHITILALSPTLTELFCTKKVYNRICRLHNISWQGLQEDYRTYCGLISISAKGNL